MTMSILIKIGTRLLTTEDNRLDKENLSSIAAQVSDLVAAGHQVLMVSSGAITCGAEALGKVPDRLAMSQAAAAVGQPLLLAEYQQCFQKRDLRIAQVLLSWGSMENEERRANAKQTLECLLEEGVIPIINENDTVTVEEICFTDNDTLARMVAELLKVDLMVLLTDTDGVYTGNPKLDNNVQKLDSIDSVTEEVLAFADDRPTAHSRGGMRSKLEAAQYAAASGIETVIANGREPAVLAAILSGDSVGTRIAAEKEGDDG